MKSIIRNKAIPQDEKGQTHLKNNCCQASTNACTFIIEGERMITEIWKTSIVTIIDTRSD